MSDAPRLPIVYIGYSHDSAAHAAEVATLVERLRNDGFDARIANGWQLWTLNQLKDADYALVVCTEAYYRSFSNPELTTDSESHKLRVIPVVFDQADCNYIPEPLRNTSHYLLKTPEDYRKLRRHLRPVVFISYSHDSPSHRALVASLARSLREENGFEARIDQQVNGTPAEGWPLWMLNQLDDADYVLVVCTEKYYRRFRNREEPGIGKGVTWEGALISQTIYDSKCKNLKFVPVFFDAAKCEFIPEPLGGATHYVANTLEGYKDLCDYLDGVAGIELGEIGPRKVRERAKALPLFDPSVTTTSESTPGPVLKIEANVDADPTQQETTTAQFDPHRRKILLGSAAAAAVLSLGAAGGIYHVCKGGKPNDGNSSDLGKPNDESAKPKEVDSDDNKPNEMADGDNKLKLGIMKYVGYAPFILAECAGKLPSWKLWNPGESRKAIEESLRKKEATAFVGALDMGINDDTTNVLRDFGFYSFCIMFISSSNGADAVIARKEIESIKDLEGKRVGTWKGSCADTLLSYHLKVAGIENCEIIHVDQTEKLMEGFLSNSNDYFHAVAIWSPWQEQAMSNGNALITSSSDKPPHIHDGLFVHDKQVLSDHQAAFDELLTGWNEGVKEILIASQSTLEALSLWLGKLPPTVDEMRKKVKFYTVAENLEKPFQNWNVILGEACEERKQAGLFRKTEKVILEMHQGFVQGWTSRNH